MERQKKNAHVNGIQDKAIYSHVEVRKVGHVEG